jgi:hypothetical protein
VNRSRVLSANLSLLCFAFALAVLGCQKAANPQHLSPPPDVSSKADNPAPPAANQPPPTPAPAHNRTPSPPPPRPLIVPADTVISVLLDQAVGSKISTPGQAFSATVQVPIEVDGRLAIPRGARASGFVKDAKPAGRFKGGALLSLSLTSITVKNQDYNIQTTAPTENSTGKGKRTAGMVGGGAGGGALVGGLAGGGKGALIGGLIGAAVGTGGAGFTGKRDITLAAETPLTFKLLEALEIKRRR